MTETQLQAYLDRIEYRGPQSPTLPCLQALQQQHLYAVPFENLDIHLGVRIELDTERIFQKIVINRRGGFCYELNGLFYELLSSLGFAVKRVSAIVMDANQQWTAEYDHMSLVVSIEGRDYLSDVGFGRFCFLPIPLIIGQEQQDQEGRFRVEAGPAERLLITKWTEAGWQAEFAFSQEAQPFAAFAERCDYQQDAPSSHFQKQRMITLPTPQGRLTLTDQSFKITRPGQAFHEVAIQSEADFVAKLWEHFGVKL